MIVFFMSSLTKKPDLYAQVDSLVFENPAALSTDIYGNWQCTP